MSLAYLQAGTLYQAGAGNIIGAATVVLTSLTDIYGNAITSMTPFGAKAYGTLEPDTNNEEGFTFTTLTVNANGTVTLGNVKTILAQTPYTESVGLVRSHSGGTKVVITDNVAFWNTFANKQNDETLTGRWGTVVVPSAGNDLVNKTYVDGVTVAGAPNANTTTKGIVELPTQAEVDARTTTGGTGAGLAVTPDTLRSTKYSDYIADAGSTDAYAITTVPATTAYAAGQEFTFKANTLNTGAATLNVNGLGAKTIKKNGGLNDLDTGDIIANQDVKVIYDGTNMQMVSPPARQAVTQDGGPIFAADAGASDTYVITLAPAPLAYVTGMVVRFKANTINTGPATLNVNGLGAITIKKKFNVDLDTGDIKASQIVSVGYDGTNFQMLSKTSNDFTGLTAKGTSSKNLTDASTTQNIAHGLGAIPASFRVAGVSPVGGLAFSFGGNSISNTDGSSNLIGQASASFLLHSGTAGAYQTGTVTADATNIIITWVKTGSPSGTVNLIWEAFV